MWSPRLACALAALLVIAFLGLSSAEAAIVQKMNLEALCDSAGSILRARVERVEQVSVRLHGQEIPALAYTLEIRDGLKGVADDQLTMTLTMLDPSRLPHVKTAAGVQHVSVLPDLPHLELGAEYLLITTRPGPGGLATTVGLAQGLFRILPGPGGLEQVRNGIDNIGLLDGMAVPKSIRSNALTYGQITTLIRHSLGESR